MQIDLNQELLNLNGTVAEEKYKSENEELKSRPITLRTLISAALQNRLQGDDKLTAKQLAERYELILRVHKEQDAEFTVEEIVEIKDRIIRSGLSVLLTGQILNMLEGKPTGIEKIEK